MLNNRYVVREIFSYLSYDDHESGNYYTVCKSWMKIIKDDSEPGFLSDIVIEKHTPIRTIIRHMNTLRHIHIKYIQCLEFWIPFTFPKLRSLHLERCTFDNMKYLIPPTPSNKTIKLERCNLEVDAVY